MCPSKEDLRRYLDEDLDDAKQAAIEAHLQHCSQCFEALEAMDDASAGDIGVRLRRPGGQAAVYTTRDLELDRAEALKLPKAQSVNNDETGVRFRTAAEINGRLEHSGTVPSVVSKVCTQCGRDVSGEIGELRHGEYVCFACKGDPSRLVRFLLKEASLGDKGLRVLRGYTLQKELGRGGMGAVFLIRHDETGDLLALKLMLPRVAVQPDAQERFLREAENTRALVHRNVVRMRDSGYAHGIFFFTLEYCSGGSVDKLLKRRGGTLPIAEAGQIILQALEGLEYAHNAEAPFVPLAEGGMGRGCGLVHRDLKPQNLFLSGTENSLVAEVGDFGLAKAFDLAGLTGLTASGYTVGTPSFMPRQLVINFKYARPEVDVWAIAASFYYMLTGACPRELPRGKDPFLAVLQTETVPIRRRLPKIPKPLAEFIDHVLIDNPEIPFKSAGDFKRVLQQLL